MNIYGYARGPFFLLLFLCSYFGGLYSVRALCSYCIYLCPLIAVFTGARIHARAAETSTGLRVCDFGVYDRLIQSVAISI